MTGCPQHNGGPPSPGPSTRTKQNRATCFWAPIIGIALVILSRSTAIAEQGVEATAPRENATNLTLVDAFLAETDAGNYMGPEVRWHGHAMMRWTQRSSFLHFFRDEVSAALKWKTAAMGFMVNSFALFGNKKAPIVWRGLNPGLYQLLEDSYLPRQYSDSDMDLSGIQDTDLYVYKPYRGGAGMGIKFMAGMEAKRFAAEKGPTTGHHHWVLQQFVDPFLWRGKKTHVRAWVLGAAQPGGSVDVYLYRRMNLFVAAVEFDPSALRGDAPPPHMLLTNNHFAEAYLNRTGQEYHMTDYCRDLKVSMEEEGKDFAATYQQIKAMHNLIASTGVTSCVECVRTDSSVYDDTCFQMLAVDIALDKDGHPYWLEMNTWPRLEQPVATWGLSGFRKMTAGAAALLQVGGAGSEFDRDAAQDWDHVHSVPQAYPVPLHVLS